MAGLGRRRNSGGNGPVDTANSQDRSQMVYEQVYPSLDKPSTSYASTRIPLRSVNSVGDETKNVGIAPLQPPVVNRHPRRDGLLFEYAYGSMPTPTPQMPQAVFSSHFQPIQVALHPWMINLKWYIAYPAATVMNGGRHNLGLSEKTPQVSTRISGGPGTQQTIMGSRPKFNKVQRIPRYPTGPSAYNTKSAGS